MKEQLSAPEVRFEGFDTNWSQFSLKEVAMLTSGMHLAPEDYSASGTYPYFTGPSDITSNLAEVKKFTEKSKQLAKRGEILITVKGSGVGKTAFCMLPKAFLGRQLMSINASPALNPLIQALLEQRVNKLESLAMGNMIPGLSRADILSFKVFLPESEAEQQKIASFLSKVDEKIALLTEKKAKLTEYKKGVMQQLFDGKWQKQEGKLVFVQPTLRFKADDGSEFPDWESKKGNELFDSISDKNHNSDLPVLAITQSHGAIPRDLIDYQVSVADSSIASYKVVGIGDFIISLRSFQGGIEYSAYKGICSPAYVILRSKLGIVDDFYKPYLKTFSFILEMQKRLEGIRDGKIISYKYFSEIKIPYPSIAEQEKIAGFLNAIDKKIELTKTELSKTKEWKKGLLQQMFV